MCLLDPKTNNLNNSPSTKNSIIKRRREIQMDNSQNMK